MSAAASIDVRGLTKRFGDKVAVDNIDITIPEGEIWGFLGPNGSGKTTTIRMLCGLLRPDGGSGQCLGFDVRREAEKIKTETGYMTQHFSFWEDLTVRENLDFVARLYGLPERTRRVSDMLTEMGLADRAGQLAGGLSGGWKQRLALAACLIHNPKLLLLDEPTAGVDPRARREFWDKIHGLSARGITVLVSTHYMDEAERCDKIVYIHSGHIIARGTVPAIIRASGLITYTLQGAGVRTLAGSLTETKGVASAAFFGAELHVSGYDEDQLNTALTLCRDRTDITLRRASPSLEDVFIELQSGRGQCAYP